MVTTCWRTMSAWMRAASSSVSAAVTLSAAMTYGSDITADGSNVSRYTATACSSIGGNRCEAKEYGSPSFAASCAPYSDDPSTYSGTLVPRPGIAWISGSSDSPLR